MTNLLLDFIDKIDKVSYRFLNGRNGRNLPEVVSDDLCFGKTLREITDELSYDTELSSAIRKARSHLLKEQDKWKYK